MDRIARNEDEELARQRVVDLAGQILSSSIDVLEGALQIHALRSQANVDDADAEFDAFTAVVSETDALPIGRQRAFWAAEALARKEPELARARSCARAALESACTNLIRRFGNS